MGADQVVELLERDVERAALASALEDARSAGRIAVVVGEAGISKTSLVSAVCAGAADRRVLWGACDPLITPRPLGPLRDAARDAGGAMLAAIDGAGAREAVLAAALDELAAGAVLVVEDLHWADDATLDLVALVGRRLVRSPGCLVLTCRTDALGERPEVRRVLGALPRECVRRVAPEPLSEGAVALLAARAGRDAAELYTLTAGNPFYVTELLGAGDDGGVPASVRDAVALRIAGISSPARAVVELAAVVPRAAELWLLPEPVAADAGAIDECIEAGLLTLRGEAVAFRHDLARRAVEDAIPPARRRDLDRLVLFALELDEHADPARLAHHARRAGDVEAIRRLAPPAARAARAAGGHRQAFEHWEAALAAEEGGDPRARAQALEGVAVEGYLCGRAEEALEARRALLAIHEAAGDRRAAGDDLRWLSRLLWWTGHGEEAAELGDRAIAVLEAFPDSRELARALSGRSQLAMLSDDHANAISLGSRAVDIARRVDDRETVAHALTNVGTTLHRGRDPGPGRAMLEEAFALAAAAGEDDHAARALVNMAVGTLTRHRGNPRVVGDIERALRFVLDRGLDGYVQYVLGARANLRLMLGEWPAAAADAVASLDLGEQPGVSRCPALIALGRLGARRGEAEAGPPLEEAWRLALKTQELQRIGPAAAARAEHAWLDGDLAGVAAAARPAYELALRHDDVWAHGELAFWLWRAGEPVTARDDDPEPYRRSIAGDWRGAADAWAALGFPYERADALSESGDEAARLEALAAFDAQGAARAAANLRRRLRAAGVRRIPRGPRPAARAAPGGLTPREREVLDLLVAGATNAQIAQTLVIAPKTVDHHVSAVLGKLGVTSRREAGAAAARLDAGRGGSPVGAL